MGWKGIDNGELLKRMKGEGFAALITYDKNLHSQQNLKDAGIGIVVIELAAKSYPNIRDVAPKIVKVLEFLQAGQVVTVSA
jgi:hypothetical protein